MCLLWRVLRNNLAPECFSHQFQRCSVWTGARKKQGRGGYDSWWQNGETYMFTLLCKLRLVACAFYVHMGFMSELFLSVTIGYCLMVLCTHHFVSRVVLSVIFGRLSSLALHLCSAVFKTPLGWKLSTIWMSATLTEREKWTSRQQRLFWICVTVVMFQCVMVNWCPTFLPFFSLCVRVCVLYSVPHTLFATSQPLI